VLCACPSAAAEPCSPCLRPAQRVAFFGAPVASGAFTPWDLSLTSPYFRGAVERRALPSALLLAAALVLLLSFILWRAPGWPRRKTFALSGKQPHAVRLQEADPMPQVPASPAALSCA